MSPYRALLIVHGQEWFTKGWHATTFPREMFRVKHFILVLPVYLKAA